MIILNGWGAIASFMNISESIVKHLVDIHSLPVVPGILDEPISSDTLIDEWLRGKYKSLPQNRPTMNIV